MSGKVSRFYVSCSWSDVPHLSKEEVDQLYDALPPHQRDARSKGIPALGSGAIFPVPESDIVCAPFELPPHWRRGFALDVGWNRTACLWFAWDEQDDIVYLYSEHYRGLAEPSVHAEAIRSRGEELNGVIDPAARGRAQKDGESLMAMYQDLGLKLSIADNSVEAGIYEVYQRLSTGRMRVFNTLQNWLSEYRIYRRDEKGKIVKENDHLMDCSRYAIMTGLGVSSMPAAYFNHITQTPKHQVNYNALAPKHVQLDTGSGMGQHQVDYNPLRG